MSEEKRALLVVDVQNDFCPGGALAVEEGDKVVPVLNQYIRVFREHDYPVLASRDWHPEETTHFEEFGGKWPPHCIQNTEGAEFHKDLSLPDEAVILSKGMGYDADSYSAFFGVDDKDRKCVDILKNLGVEELYVGGLATDYCVKASVLDALKFGFTTHLLTDATRGVDMEEGDVDKAVQEMTSMGAKTIQLDKLKSLFKETHA